jgi:hypothetical protein
LPLADIDAGYRFQPSGVLHFRYNETFLFTIAARSPLSYSYHDRTKEDLATKVIANKDSYKTMFRIPISPP